MPSFTRKNSMISASSNSSKRKKQYQTKKSSCIDDDDDDHHTLSTVGEHHDIIDEGEGFDHDVEVMIAPMTWIYASDELSSNNNPQDQMTLPGSSPANHVYLKRLKRRRRILVGIALFIGLITLILGIILPLHLRNDKTRNNPSKDTSKDLVESSFDGEPAHQNEESGSPAYTFESGDSVSVKPEISKEMIQSNHEQEEGAIVSQNDDLNGAATEDGEDSSNKNDVLRPFPDVQLKWLDDDNDDIVQGYSNNNLQDLKDDLTNAAKFLVNNVVVRQLKQQSKNGNSDGISGSSGWGMSSGSTIMNVPVTEMGWRGSSVNRDMPTSGVGDVTGYETNNQEKGIDEADIIKADKNYIYAAYNDYVLVWDKYGNQVTQVSMPPTTNENDEGEYDNGDGGGGFIMMMSSKRYSFYQHKAHIETLMLTEDGYLVVVVSGYGKDLRQQNRGDEETAVLHDYLGTQIRTYQTSALANQTPELTLIATKNVHGRYLDAQTVGNHVHITTVSGLDTYRLLVEPFQYINFKGMNDEEYVEAVKVQAINFYVPQFVKLLLEDLSIGGNDAANELSFAENIMKIHRWQKLPMMNDSGSQSIMDNSVLGAGIANSIVFITSLDVTAEPQRNNDSNLSDELVTSTSIFFAPTQLMHMYGTESSLILASRSFDWNTNLGAAEEVTHLVLLDLASKDESASAKFRSISTVRGTILNPYSLDIFGSDFRIATTITKRWILQRRQRTSTVDPSSKTHNVVEESLTENYITVLDMNKDMSQRGSIQIGKVDEVIMAVRFFDTIAYAITFDSADPFYVLDLSDGVNILGEYKTNGFSNYLHPMINDKSILLSIGQNTTEDGQEAGMMISVFDAHNPIHPELLTSYTIANDDHDSPGITSSAQWDYKSFRYANGKLIIPLDIYSSRKWDDGFDAIEETLLDNFDGFIVFNVSTSSIGEHFRVSHIQDGICHHCGYLSPRSYIFDGNIMTVEGNSVYSTNLDNAEKQWSFNVTIDGETPDCCF